MIAEYRTPAPNWSTEVLLRVLDEHAREVAVSRAHLQCSRCPPAPHRGVAALTGCITLHAGIALRRPMHNAHRKPASRPPLAALARTCSERRALALTPALPLAGEPRVQRVPAALCVRAGRARDGKAAHRAEQRGPEPALPRPRRRLHAAPLGRQRPRAPDRGLPPQARPPGPQRPPPPPCG